MKKDIEWLRNEINELPIIFIGFSILKQREEFGINKDDVLELIDQLDEPETQKIIELKHEISKLESNNMELHISYDEQVKSLDNKIVDLEYELFLEKTKDSKNSFYWFTAKRTPLVVDVSYLSYEDTLYGFKGVPNYHFIEKHDLRFVTHCPLDDLIEQYR